MSEFERAAALAIATRDALEAGDPRGALVAGVEAIALLSRLQADASPDVAYLLLLSSRAHAAADELVAAERTAEQATQICRLLAGDDEITARLRVQTSQRLGKARLARGDYAGARAALQAALDDATALLPGDDPDLRLVLNDLGMIGKYDGRFEEAAGHYARAMRLAVAAGDEPLVATLEHNLAGLAHSRGDYAGAEPHARAALAINARLFGPDDPRAAGDEGELAEILAAQGKLDEALALVRRATDTFTARYGPDHLEVGIARTSLGAMLHRGGDLAAAEREYRAGLAIREVCVGSDHPELAPSLINLATLLAGRGDAAGAERNYRRALAVLDGQVTAGHPRRLVCLERLAELLDGSGRGHEAARLRAAIPG